MKAPGISSGSAEAVEANTFTLKKLIVEATGLIRWSKDVLARLKTRVLAQCPSGLETSESRAPNVFEQITERPHHEERRRDEDLSPDIIALLASCGERVRQTDSTAIRTYTATRK